MVQFPRRKGSANTTVQLSHVIHVQHQLIFQKLIHRLSNIPSLVKKISLKKKKTCSNSQLLLFAFCLNLQVIAEPGIGHQMTASMVKEASDWFDKYLKV